MFFLFSRNILWTKKRPTKFSTTQQDSDFGSGFTVKEYHSKKEIGQDNWSHKQISLKPLSSSKEYKEIILNQDEGTNLKIVGIFVDVLK